MQASTPKANARRPTGTTVSLKGQVMKCRGVLHGRRVPTCTGTRSSTQRPQSSSRSPVLSQQLPGTHEKTKCFPWPCPAKHAAGEGLRRSSAPWRSRGLDTWAGRPEGGTGSPFQQSLDVYNQGEDVQSTSPPFLLCVRAAVRAPLVPNRSCGLLMRRLGQHCGHGDSAQAPGPCCMPAAALNACTNAAAMFLCALASCVSTSPKSSACSSLTLSISARLRVRSRS